MDQQLDPDPRPTDSHGGLLSWWITGPLYLRILAALVLGLTVGVLLRRLVDPAEVADSIHLLALPSKLIMRLLGALAPPLILLAVVQALIKTPIGGRKGARLVSLLALNTLVAIGIGLLVANLVRPGRWASLEPIAVKPADEQAANPILDFLDNIPRSLLGPLGDHGNVMGVIMIAVAFGVALRQQRHAPVRTVEDVVSVAFGALSTLLHWVIAIIPLAVFSIVASIVAEKGFRDFAALGAFVVAVLLALLLQAGYYLTRVRLLSWVRPVDLLRGTRDALVMAFSTASSTATMPVTYACLKDKVGLREESASMGALVGANFNNDGTALYEAMSALFVAQMLGMNLSIQQQLLVVLTSVVASVGAAGIPEAGLVTMTLVFKAAGLPTEYIALLLTVDWFLDRCRTAINVMGDTNVSCILDGKQRPIARVPVPEPPPAAPAPPEILTKG
jgi:DAACS family dicarboxylate/amino acid:cation (Na+ or H+) symporter